MWMYLVLAGAVIVVVAHYLFRRSLASGVSRAIQQAVESGDIAPILAGAEALPQSRRSLYFQTAIKTLWDGWNRPLAVAVIKEFAKKHSDEKICQFWMKQALEIEPVAAQKTLDQGFLKNHYRPEVANCCGKGSS